MITIFRRPIIVLLSLFSVVGCAAKHPAAGMEIEEAPDQQVLTASLQNNLSRARHMESRDLDALAKAEDIIDKFQQMKAPPSPTKMEYVLYTSTEPGVTQDAEKVVNPVLTSTSAPWKVTANSSFRKTISDFAKRAGWTVIFCLKNQQTLEDQDYILNAGLEESGDFKQAVNTTINALPASTKVRGDLWSQNAPPLLHIYRQGEAQLCN